MESLCSCLPLSLSLSLDFRNMTDPFPRKRLFRKEGRKEDSFGGGLDFNLHILFSRRGSERKSRVRCAPPGKQRPPVCFVFRPRSPPRRILPFVSSSGDIFQIQPTVPRKHGISQIFLDAPSIPPSRVSIVQAVIHEPLDLDRSTIYCPLNLAHSIRGFWANFARPAAGKTEFRLKKKKIFSGRGSLDGWNMGMLHERIRTFYPTAKCWHTSRSTIAVTKTPPPLSHTRDIARFV